MITNCRANLADLVRAIESNCKQFMITHELHLEYMKAEEALSQPEPVGPTDDEIDALVVCIQALPASGKDDLALPSIDGGRDMIRRFLARWSTPPEAHHG
jgi:hypothetical protein